MPRPTKSDVNPADLQPAVELAFDVLEFVDQKTNDGPMQAAALGVALGFLLASAPDLESAAEYFKQLIKQSATFPGGRS